MDPRPQSSVGGRQVAHPKSQPHGKLSPMDLRFNISVFCPWANSMALMHVLQLRI
jgi:hypothetical protein